MISHKQKFSSLFSCKEDTKEVNNTYFMKYKFLFENLIQNHLKTKYLRN